MRFKVDGILFDLDGTLVDSLADIHASVNHTMARLRLPEIPVSDVRHYVGDGLHILLRRCLERHESVTEPLMEKALGIYRTHHAGQCTTYVEAYPHVRSVLQNFEKKPKAVISNKPYDFTLRILQHLKLETYFDIILGGDSLPEKKPDPAPLLHILHRWRCSPDRAVMVGDGRQDIAAGKAAGVRTIAVRGGFDDRLEDADVVIDDIARLTDLLT
jgi:phosphoglycolate phosphatase